MVVEAEMKRHTVEAPCRRVHSSRGANDVSRVRVQLSSTRTRKIESELDSSSKARELEK